MIWTIVVGIVAGWLAGQFMRGKGFGVLGDLVVGLVGGVLGGLIFGMLGLAAYGLLGQIVMATVGAVVLVYLVRMIG